MQTIIPCLWFDSQAEEAVRFYVSVFPDSRIVETSYYLEGLPRPAGSVLTIRFILDGQEFLAMNGGPVFTFSAATSFVAWCDTQPQVDHLWDSLGSGGRDAQCGWVTDRFGVTWQVVPRALPAMLMSTDKVAAQRALNAMLKMKKLDIAALQHAFDNA